jgi:hypothetical protein
MSPKSLSLVIIVATSAVLVWFQIFGGPSFRDSRSPEAGTHRSTLPAPDRKNVDSAANIPKEARIPLFVADPARTALGDLRRATTKPEDSLRILARMRNQLWEADPAELPGYLDAFFRSAEDAATGLRFQVGHEGALDAAPSLRVALLDLYGRLEPGHALQVSREITAALADADEVAIALRNLHTVDDEATVPGILGLLGHRDWRQRPTAGFLEAFDVAVARPEEDVWRALADVATDDGAAQSARWAGITALRTLGQRNAAFPLLLVADPAVLVGDPGLRGEIIARLNLARAAERTALEGYLRSSPSESEVRGFLSRFPNVHPETGPRLVNRLDEFIFPLEQMAWLDLEALRFLGSAGDHLSPAFRNSITFALDRLSTRQTAIADSNITPTRPE